MNPSTTMQSGSAISTSDSTAHSSATGSMRNAIALGIVGAIAAVLSYVAIRQTGRVFELPADLLKLKLAGGRNQSPEVIKQFNTGLAILDYKHAALWVGTAGAIVGVLFSLALSVIRRSTTSILTGALSGFLAGGLVSACGGLLANCFGANVVLPVRLEKAEVPVYYSMLLHGSTWLIVGLGIGLGTGLGVTKNRIRSALVSMFMGGVAGAAAGAFYPFVAIAVMPLIDPSLTIPNDGLNLLVWLGMPIIFIGLTLGRRA